MSLLKALLSAQGHATGAVIASDAYRKSHEIDGSTEGEQTDYQVKINAHYSGTGQANSEKSGFKALTLNSEWALYENGEIIFPYQTGAPDNDINVKIYDSATFAELHDYTVGTDPIPTDFHGAPAIIKFGSYFVLLYGEHYETGTLKVAYSLDLENWTVYSFPLAGGFTYPQLFIWGGNLYLLIRHSVGATQTIWRLYNCTDVTNSGTWSLIGTIVDEGVGYAPYVVSRVVDDGVGGDRLLLVWGRYEYGTPDYEKYLMCAYTDDLTNWKDTEGDPIALPLDKDNSLLATLDYKLHFGRAEGYGNTLWITPWWGEPANSLLIKKVIGGALSTHDLGETGVDGELFYHSGEGYLRLYMQLDIAGDWKVRRYKLQDSTITIEQTYGAIGTEKSRMTRRIYPEVDWVIAELMTGALDNNVNPILICTDAAIGDSNEDIYLNGHCRTDFGDIRFTESDGSTELNYWLKEKVDSGYAIFWIKVPTIPVSPGTVTIYIYYGKEDATTNSSIKDASWNNIGDDFNDNSRDAAIWDECVDAPGSVAETNQRLEITAFGGAPNGAGYVSVNDFAMNNVLMELLIHNSAVTDVELTLSNQKVTAASPFSNDDWYKIMLYANTGRLYVQSKVGGGGVNTLYNQPWLADEEKVKIRIENGTIRFYEGDTERASEVFALTSRDCYLYIYGSDAYGTDPGTDWADLLWIRKYVDPEPVNGDWGSEEGVVWPF